MSEENNSVEEMRLELEKEKTRRQEAESREIESQAQLEEKTAFLARVAQAQYQLERNRLLDYIKITHPDKLQEYEEKIVGVESLEQAKHEILSDVIKRTISPAIIPPIRSGTAPLRPQDEEGYKPFQGDNYVSEQDMINHLTKQHLENKRKYGRNWDASKDEAYQKLRELKRIALYDVARYMDKELITREITQLQNCPKCNATSKTDFNRKGARCPVCGFEVGKEIYYKRD